MYSSNSGLYLCSMCYVFAVNSGSFKILESSYSSSLFLHALGWLSKVLLLAARQERAADKRMWSCSNNRSFYNCWSLTCPVNQC